MGGLASRACFGPETYKLVDGWVDEVDRMVEKLRLSRGVQETEAPGEVVELTNNLMNPPKSAKKGRPKDKEKRKKPLLEHLQDKAKKKAAKNSRRRRISTHVRTVVMRITSGDIARNYSSKSRCKHNKMKG
jgi:hypothetical protein